MDLNDLTNKAKEAMGNSGDLKNQAEKLYEDNKDKIPGDLGKTVNDAMDSVKGMFGGNK